MTSAIQFDGEVQSNEAREVIATQEPVALRTFTPSQAVLAKSAGVFHYTPEGRRLYDYSSGVLVANLGHNPTAWLRKLGEIMQWSPNVFADGGDGYTEAVGLTAYNAVTEVETAAVKKLIQSVQSSAGGEKLDTVMWAASGSEAVQKALWACLHADESRDIILATRYGFHGKKGLAGAVTGCEDDRDRDPRVKFLSFPMAEIADVTEFGDSIDLTTYQQELDAIANQYAGKMNCLITEPYLGGGGSYHPPASYLQLLENFCREHNMYFILDEVQSNFGRTGKMYAFEKYGISPDFVTLGKGLGNGVPVSAVVGRGDVMASLKYGEASDTWSANPLACAAVIATLDQFEATGVMSRADGLYEKLVAGLLKLKETGIIKRIRGEGMVFGIECDDVGNHAAKDVANAVVEACYRGQDGGDGIHLLGPLASTVLRVSPPMTITDQEADDSLQLLYDICSQLAQDLQA